MPLAKTLPILHAGSCSCGAITIETVTEPMLVVNCHCTKCREFTSESFSGTTLFWMAAVHIKGFDSLQFKQTSVQFGLVGLNRGRCSKCQDPAIDIGRGMLGVFCCPSAKVLHLEPTANMFYDSGQKQGILGLKTYYSDFASNVFVYPILLFKGIPQLWFLLIARIEGKSCE